MEQPQRDTGFGKFTRILGMIMSFVYITIGMALFTGSVNLPIDLIWMRVLGIAIVIYGGFRFYRAFKGNPGNR
jgi:cytochrome c biogenesis protein CcdA